MFLKRFAVLIAALSIGVAACSGASNSVSDPLPHGPGVTTAGTVLSPTLATGVTATSVTVTGSGNVNATESTTPPGSLPAIASAARAGGTTTQSVKPDATVANSALVYVSITASAAASISGIPASSFTFTNVPAGSVFLAYFNTTSNAWVTISGPGTVSGSTVSFGAVTFSPAIALAIGASLNLAVYTGAAIATPSPSPSPSPSPTPTHSPAPTPTPSGATPGPSPVATNIVVNGDFEGGTYTATGFEVNNATTVAPAPNVLPTGWYICQNNSELQPSPAPSPTQTAYYTQVINSSNSTAILHGETLPGTASYAHGGTGAAMLGNVNAGSAPAAAQGGTKGNYGFCQDIVVPTTGQLTFWVSEGSGGTSSTTTGTNVYVTPPGPSATSFPVGSAQEAAILDPTTHTMLQQLFVELDGAQGNPTFSTASNTAIGFQTAYVQKGPYTLTASPGTSVSVFFGLWRNSAATTAFTFMFVDDVSFVGVPFGSSNNRSQGQQLYRAPVQQLLRR